MLGLGLAFGEFGVHRRAEPYSARIPPEETENVLGKYQITAFKFRGRQFRCRLRLRLAKGHVLPTTTHEDYSMLHSLSFEQPIVKLTRLSQRQRGWNENNTIRAAPYCREYICFPGSHVRYRRRQLIGVVVWHGRDRQYTSPRFCQVAPGVDNTSIGRRKTKVESQIAVNTLVLPGWMFTVIEVGPAYPVYGTLDTVKTCSPAGNHA